MDTAQRTEAAHRSQLAQTVTLATTARDQVDQLHATISAAYDSTKHPGITDTSNDVQQAAYVAWQAVRAARDAIRALDRLAYDEMTTYPATIAKA